MTVKEMMTILSKLEPEQELIVSVYDELIRFDSVYPLDEFTVIIDAG